VTLVPLFDGQDPMIHVVQGEFAIANDPGVVLTTVLGSCVAVCMRDPGAGVGGMNHFLLPGGKPGEGSSVVYGVNAMELLINALLKAGARRSHLEAKIFGGATMLESIRNIGASNIEFALKFLETERIPCIGRSVGGSLARRVKYWPVTGRARQRQMQETDLREIDLPINKPAAPSAPPTDDDIEFF